MSDNIGYNLESKVDYTWEDDILSGVTQQILKKDDEIITESVLEHFQMDFSSLREFLSIKANGGYLYLCCEENYNGCGTEAGAVSDLEIKKTVDEALGWFIERIKTADEEQTSVLDEENEDYRFYKSRQDMVRNRFSGEIEEFGRTSIIVFIGHQDNWEYHYEIVVRKIKVF